MKAEAERSIHTSMHEILDRLPDLDVYQRIYPDPVLGRMLAKAYGDVILFAQHVVVYCQSHGFGKCWPLGTGSRWHALYAKS